MINDLFGKLRGSQGDHNVTGSQSPESYDMGVQVPCRVHAEYRKKALFGHLRRLLGSVFHDLARRKEGWIEEGHLMPDHVHIPISIPPKYSVAG
ncbi:hypothetical protein BKD02_14010 [Brucella sp. 09RB8910]|nr:hypothetical protein BKD02_14010 [Brucella sp. 09RB8910]